MPSGKKPLHETILTKCPTPYGVTRPQWVNPQSYIYKFRRHLLHTTYMISKLTLTTAIDMLKYVFKRILEIQSTAKCYSSITHTLRWRSCFNMNCLPTKDPRYVNLSSPRQNGRHIADAIFKCIFVNENLWFPFKISPKCVPKDPNNNILRLIQINGLAPFRRQAII